ncbi:MAG: hypothetical protein LBT42_05550 [Tannerella sp.]|jgi:hypothetical protein|nr:hypothetical protein [Tannerella sp.]
MTKHTNALPIKDSLPSLRGTKQSGALYIFWIASFLAMTAGADGKYNGFASSFFLFAKLVQ